MAKKSIEERLAAFRADGQRRARREMRLRAKRGKRWLRLWEKAAQGPLTEAEREEWRRINGLDRPRLLPVRLSRL